MKTVVSQLTSSRRPCGSWDRMDSIFALTSRPTWTALAPRIFVMPNPIDDSPIARLSRRRSSRPSSTTATSFRRTGAPFTYVTTRLLNDVRSIASP